MIFIEFLVALAVGLLVLAFMGAGFRRWGPWARRDPGTGVIWFLVVVVLGAWAIGTWATPVGPMYSGVAWLPFLVGAIVFGLLLSAVSEPRPRTAAVAPAEAESDAALTLGGFFWVLTLALALTIALGVL